MGGATTTAAWPPPPRRPRPCADASVAATASAPARCEVWTPTQNGEAALAVTSEASGLPPAQCEVYKLHLGGGFGHFYAYAPVKIEYAIDRFAMETKRQLDVLDRRLAESPYLAGDDYTIADIAVWPWYGGLAKGLLYGAGEFLAVHEYKNVQRWAKEIDARPAVKRGRMVNRAMGDPSEQLLERHGIRLNPQVSSITDAEVVMPAAFIWRMRSSTSSNLMGSRYICCIRAVAFSLSSSRISSNSGSGSS